MASNTHEYVAGGESPVSGVTHLFTGEGQDGRGPAKSLCGAVGSYGPFRSTDEVDEGEVCKNCARVREQRETEEEA